MKAIKDNIKKILEENISLRNNRQLFIWLYYETHYPDIIYSTAGLFLKSLWLKQLPSTATLERLWRMVQMENPELRGSEWNKRQRKVKPVQKDLGYNVKKGNENIIRSDL